MDRNESPGVIEPGNLYVADEARRRLRIGVKTWTQLRAAGLPVRRLGRTAYVLGDDLLLRAQAGGGRAMSKTITAVALAKEWGCGINKVHFFISSKQLRALNLARNPNGRPRYVIKRDDIEAFEKAREVGTSTEKPKPPRRRRRKDRDFVEIV